MQKFIPNVIVFRFYHRYWFVRMIFVVKMFVTVVVADMLVVLFGRCRSSTISCWWLLFGSLAYVTNRHSTKKVWENEQKFSSQINATKKGCHRYLVSSDDVPYPVSVGVCVPLWAWFDWFLGCWKLFFVSTWMYFLCSLSFTRATMGDILCAWQPSTSLLMRFAFFYEREHSLDTCTVAFCVLLLRKKGRTTVRPNLEFSTLTQNLRVSETILCTSKKRIIESGNNGVNHMTRDV